MMKHSLAVLELRTSNTSKPVDDDDFFPFLCFISFVYFVLFLLGSIVHLIMLKLIGLKLIEYIKLHRFLVIFFL